MLTWLELTNRNRAVETPFVADVEDLVPGDLYAWDHAIRALGVIVEQGEAASRVKIRDMPPNIVCGAPLPGLCVRKIGLKRPLNIPQLVADTPRLDRILRVCVGGEGGSVLALRVQMRFDGDGTGKGGQHGNGGNRSSSHCRKSLVVL